MRDLGTGVWRSVHEQGGLRKTRKDTHGSKKDTPGRKKSQSTHIDSFLNLRQWEALDCIQGSLLICKQEQEHKPLQIKNKSTRNDLGSQPCACLCT